MLLLYKSNIICAFCHLLSTVPITITAQPTNSTVLVDGDATFTCSAYGTAPIDLTWYRVDSGTEGAAPTRIDDNSVTSTLTGSTEVTVRSTLTLASIGTADDGAMFYCEATNNLTEAGVFTNQSDSATLTVQCKVTQRREIISI